MNITALLGICIIATAAAVLLKNYKPEYALTVAVVAGIVVFVTALLSVVGSLGRLRSLIENTGIEMSYFKVAFKALGICVVTGFVADICRDFGQTSLASRAEFVGKCAVFILSVPLLTTILEIAYGFIN